MAADKRPKRRRAGRGRSAEDKRVYREERAWDPGSGAQEGATPAEEVEHRKTEGAPRCERAWAFAKVPHTANALCHGTFPRRCAWFCDRSLTNLGQR